MAFADLIRTAIASVVVIVAAGCASDETVRTTETPPGVVRARIVGLLPPSLRDREGWADDIQRAFAALKLVPTQTTCARCSR